MPTFFIKELKGVVRDAKTWQVNVPNHVTIINLKMLLAQDDYTGIPFSQLKIAYKGRILHPDSRLLGYYDVQDNDEMYVFARMDTQSDANKGDAAGKAVQKVPKWVKNRIHQLFFDLDNDSFKRIDQIIWEKDRYRVPSDFVVNYLIKEGALKHVKQKSGIRYLRDMHRGGIESHFPDPRMPEDDDVRAERIQAPLFDYGRDNYRWAEIWPSVVAGGMPWENRVVNMYDRWVLPSYMPFIMANRLGFDMSEIDNLDIVLVLIKNLRCEVAQDATAANGWAVTLRSRNPGREDVLHPPMVIGQSLQPLLDHLAAQEQRGRERSWAERTRRLNRVPDARNDLEFEIQNLYTDGVAIKDIRNRLTSRETPTLRQVVDILVRLELVKVLGYPTLTTIQLRTFWGVVDLDLGTSARFNAPYNRAVQGNLLTASQQQAQAGRPSSEELATLQLMDDQAQGFVSSTHTPAGLRRLQEQRRDIHTPAGLGRSRGKTLGSDIQVEAGSRVEERDLPPWNEEVNGEEPPWDVEEMREVGWGTDEEMRDADWEWDP
jgi:Ubiquitin family